MSKTTHITIEGTPKSLKRHRHTRNGHTYNPSAGDMKEARELIRIATPSEPPKGLISLIAIFYMPRPKSHYRTGKYADQLKDSAPDLHSIKPDLDNLIKFVFDTFNGVLWEDDKQIAFVNAYKIYDESPRTELTIHEHDSNQVLEEFTMDEIRGEA